MLKVNYVLKGQFYKGIIRKMTMSFSYNSFVKSHGKKIWESHYGHVISKFVL